MTSRHGGCVLVGDHLAYLVRFDALPLTFLQRTTADVDMQT